MIQNKSPTNKEQPDQSTKIQVDDRARTAEIAKQFKSTLKDIEKQN